MSLRAHSLRAPQGPQRANNGFWEAEAPSIFDTDIPYSTIAAMLSRAYGGVDDEGGLAPHDALPSRIVYMMEQLQHCSALLAHYYPLPLPPSKSLLLSNGVHNEVGKCRCSKE